MLRLRFVLACALTACTLAASALPAIRGEVIKAYKIKPTSKIGSAQCDLCHVPSTTKLNPFGADLRAAMTSAKTKKITPALMKLIGAKDSDKDKATNAAEIKADTLPGDPKSKPAK